MAGEQDGSTRGTRLIGPIATASLAGLAVGLLCWWLSLSPTLIPRGWVVQAVTSGACLAIGYGLGTLIARVGGVVGARPGTEASSRLRIGLGVAWAVVGVAGIIVWPGWQNDARELVEMPHVGWWEGLPMAIASVAVGIALIWLTHRASDGLRALNGFNHRHLPAWLATPATLLLIGALIIFIGRDVIVRGLVEGANTTYGAIDDGTNEGTVQPTLATVSGSPASLVAWESLGRWGRDFAAGVTTLDELEAFHGSDADLVEPVRVYVGLRSVNDVEAQAALAVEELERTGGFDREVLVVWTATGSGWMDPDATEALEQLHGGDTAIVAIQYSFLPSFFSLIVDVGKAAEAGTELFNAVHERWSELPEDDRPQLIVFGLSLGSLGAEAPFAGPDAASSVANFEARTDGALIVGAKRDNEVLRELTAERDAGSPVWQPSYDGGATVRFVTRAPGRAGLDPGWQAPRILYLQHPSDPVSYWGPDDFWSPSAWMEHPRGHDVPAIGGWFPIVSGVHALADLAFQLSPPPGHGHDYAIDYVDAFARVVPPVDWTDADTASLETFLFAGGVDDGE